MESAGFAGNFQESAFPWEIANILIFIGYLLEHNNRLKKIIKIYTEYPLSSTYSEIASIALRGGVSALAARLPDH